MVRILAAKLAALEYLSGDVIAEIEFLRGKFSDGVEILKSHRSMKLICAATATEKVLVKFITPRKEITAAIGTRIQAESKTWRTFTAAEVLDFVEEVGDVSKIHHLTPPIVPGFLILETILSHEKFSASRKLKLKFKHFITAGEPLTLEVSAGKSEILSAGEVKVVIRQS